MRGVYGKAARRPPQFLLPGAPGEPGPVARVAGDFFHSVDDRVRAVESITAGFNAIVIEIMRWHDANPDRHAAAFKQWVTVDVLPTIDEWNKFAHRERTSWWIRAATSWQTLVDWRRRLGHLRQLARAHGIVLGTPEPDPLPQTIWEKSDGGTGNDLAPWFGIAKLVIGGAIAFTGAVTVYSVVSDFNKLRKAGKA